jgi:hypothetical protein
MDENAHPNSPSPEPPTPEVAQILRMLELQTTALRNQRGTPLAAMPQAFRGISFRWASIIVILLFAFGSIAAMEWIVSQLPKPPPPAAPISAPR